MGNKAQAKKNSEFAKLMKDRGIRRTTGTCCVCYKTIPIPTDNHFKYNCK